MKRRQSRFDFTSIKFKLFSFEPILILNPRLHDVEWVEERLFNDDGGVIDTGRDIDKRKEWFCFWLLTQPTLFDLWFNIYVLILKICFFHQQIWTLKLFYRLKYSKVPVKRRSNKFCYTHWITWTSNIGNLNYYLKFISVIFLREWIFHVNFKGFKMITETFS